MKEGSTYWIKLLADGQGFFSESFLLQSFQTAEIRHGEHCYRWFKKMTFFLSRSFPFWMLTSQKDICNLRFKIPPQTLRAEDLRMRAMKKMLHCFDASFVFYGKVWETQPSELAEGKHYPGGRWSYGLLKKIRHANIVRADERHPKVVMLTSITAQMLSVIFETCLGVVVPSN